MTIYDLLQTLVNGARNAGTIDDADTDGASYTLDEKHRAIQGVLNDFIRRTKCTRQLSTVAITALTSTVDFSGIAGFSPDRLIEDGITIVSDSSYSARDVVCSLERVDPAAVRQELARYSGDTTGGNPRLIAFTSWTIAQIARLPKATGTLNVTWAPPLVSFTPGDSGANDTIINLPDDLANTAVRTGGVVWLQNGQVENVPLNTPLKADYEAHVTRSMGLGNLGVNVIQRMSVSEARRRRY